MNSSKAAITKKNRCRTINILMFPRKHKRASSKEDNQSFLEKAHLTEVALEDLSPTECLLPVCKLSRLGS